MITWILIFVFHYLSADTVSPVPGGPASPVVDSMNFQIVDRSGTEEGYFLFLPRESGTGSKDVVLFVHGYGCINPMIYGAWIKHLIGQGHVVIYPRYQESLWKPSPTKFAINVAKAYGAAVETLDSLGIRYRTDHIAFVGHSYGGTIVSYLGVYHDSLQMPQPSVIMACQPGTGPFDALELETYAGIDSSIQVLVVVGHDDKTVGDKLGKLIFATTEVKNKQFVEHQAAEDKNITASHYEPEGIDLALDNGYRNVSANRALRLAKVDAVDSLYWSLLDHAFTGSENRLNRVNSPGDSPFPIVVK